MDYTEILCRSIDNIAKKRMNEIQFSSVRSYRITNVLDNEIGKYQIGSGDQSFTAYTLDGNNNEYRVNDWVYVLIPNNDFSENKFILSIKHMDGEEY